MEKSLEQSMQLLLTQMERSEARNVQLQRHFRWLSIAFGLTLVLLVGMAFKVQVIHDVQAQDNTQPTQQIDVQSLNMILAGGLQLMQGLQAHQEEQVEQGGGIMQELGKIMHIVDNLDKILTALATPENAKALKNMSAIINGTAKLLQEDQGAIAGAITDLQNEIKSMSHNMYVMSVDMRRMSSTATPAMGRMYDMMSIVPLP